MATISSGTTFSGTVGPGQTDTVLSGGNVTSALISGGTMVVSSGAQFQTSNVIEAGGLVTLYAGNGPGTNAAGGNSVSSGGTVEIVNGVQYASGATTNVLVGGVVDFNAVKYNASNTYSGRVVSGNELVAYVNGAFTAYTFLSTSAYDGQTFVGSFDGYDGGLDITICYLGGTMIRMADGAETAVEDLRAGDRVATLVNGDMVVRPVTWVGAKRQIVRGPAR